MARLRASLALLRDDNDELAAQVAQLRTGLGTARRGGVPKVLVGAFEEAAVGGSGAGAAPSPAPPAPAVADAELDAPPTEGEEPETPAGRGAGGSAPLAGGVAALDQLRFENEEVGALPCLGPWLCG